MSFNPKIAAGVAVLLGAAIMIGSLVTGRSARSEPPVDLSPSAADAELDVWKTAAALIAGPGTALIVDGRPAAEFARYHLPGAVSEPGAGGARLLELARGRAPVILVAARDELARRAVGEARAALRTAPVFYLRDGARSWYLTFELPVPLFAESSPPGDYEDALRTVREFFSRPRSASSTDRVAEALQRLVRIGYQPTLLKQGGKPRTSGSPKKKISGGCG
jgi:rhodanese-related sulfurtransferase